MNLVSRGDLRDGSHSLESLRGCLGFELVIARAAFGFYVQWLLGGGLSPQSPALPQRSP